MQNPECNEWYHSIYIHLSYTEYVTIPRDSENRLDFFYLIKTIKDILMK